MFLFETADGGMETVHSAGESQPNLRNVCVRGRLFSGRAREEGDALVT